MVSSYANNSSNIKNFAHEKRVQSPHVPTGFFGTPIMAAVTSCEIDLYSPNSNCIIKKIR